MNLLSFFFYPGSSKWVREALTKREANLLAGLCQLVDVLQTDGYNWIKRQETESLTGFQIGQDAKARPWSATCHRTCFMYYYPVLPLCVKYDQQKVCPKKPVLIYSSGMKNLQNLQCRIYTVQCRSSCFLQTGRRAQAIFRILKTAGKVAKNGPLLIQEIQLSAAKLKPQSEISRRNVSNYDLSRSFALRFQNRCAQPLQVKLKWTTYWSVQARVKRIKG